MLRKLRLMSVSLLVVFSLVAAFAACGVAAAPAPYVWAGQYIEAKIPAPSIQNSLLPVPAETLLAVYLPPSYQTPEASKKSYPVVYFLHGAGEEARTWSKSVSRALDEMYANGFGMNLILAFPTGRNSLGSSFYTNSPVTGNWEDHITKDVITYMDKTYRTLASPGGRAIVGFSMGGYGAITIGMKHPKLYSCGYGMSPGVFAENALDSFQPFADTRLYESLLKGLAKAASISDGTREQAKTTQWKSGIDQFSLAYGLAFAPNPDKGAPFMEFPYSVVDGKTVRDDAAWKKWYYGFGGWEEKVDLYRDNLLALRLFGFEVGSQDYYAWIRKGCAYLDGLLTSRGIPHTYSTYAGDHGDKLIERMTNTVLPLVARTLDAAK